MNIKVDVKSISECRYISIKLQGALLQKTAIFKHKKIFKIRYFTLNIGNVFTPNFEEDINSLRSETNCLQLST